jgi:hypothetical protein
VIDIAGLVLVLGLLGPQAGPSLADRIQADDVGAVRTALRGDGVPDDELTDLLWKVEERVHAQRRMGRLASATDWLSVLDEGAPRSDQAIPLQVYAAGESMAIWLHRGAPDRAAVARERLFDRLETMPAQAPGAAFLHGVAALYDLDFRVAVEDFDGAVERIDALASEVREADASIAAELENRRALAEIGRACRDPARADVAARLLRARWAAAPDGERFGLACLLATVELRRGALAAARESLALGGTAPAGDHDAAVRAATLEARFALAEGAAPAVLAQREEALAAALDASLRQRLAESDPDDAIGHLHYEFVLEALAWRIALCDALREPSRAVEAVLHAQSFGWLSRRLGGAPGGAPDLRAALPDDGALLCYVPGPDGSWLLVVEATGDSIHRLPASYRLKQDRDALARGTVERLAPGEIDAWRTDLANAASRMLPESTHAALRRARRLTICALGFLASAEFEQLPFEGEAIGRRWPIDRLPALPLAGVLARRFDRRVDLAGDGDAACALLLAPTVAPAVTAAHPAARPLTYAHDEIVALADAFPAHRVDCRIGPDADAAAFELARKATLLTLLCHGVERMDRVRPASLVLAPSGAHDGVVGCEEVESGGAPRLVVLAACRAGRGPLRGGNELALDLGGAFLAAGAGAVILAPHALEAESARGVLAAIHRELARGHSPAEALRLARSAASDRESSCGGWVVVGSGHRAPFEPVASGHRRRAWPWAAAVLVLAALVHRAVRRRPRVAADGR